MKKKSSGRSKCKTTPHTQVCGFFSKTMGVLCHPACRIVAIRGAIGTLVLRSNLGCFQSTKRNPWRYKVVKPEYTLLLHFVSSETRISDHFLWPQVLFFQTLSRLCTHFRENHKTRIMYTLQKYLSHSLKRQGTTKRSHFCASTRHSVPSGSFYCRSGREPIAILEQEPHDLRHVYCSTFSLKLPVAATKVSE